MTSDVPDPEGPVGAFRVLVVCTANQCRSPLAEYLLRDALTTLPGTGGWAVGSAGVVARDGRPMDPAAAVVLTERGLDVSGFARRRLTRELIARSDLVLTASREHRGQVAQLYPGALSRLFTLQQFGHLLSRTAPLGLAAPGGADGPTAGRALITAAAAGRAELPGRTVADDLADPIGQPIGAFRDCAATIDRAVAAVLAPLR